MIKRSIQRYTQPQYPVRVDQSNPLTKGLQDVSVLGNNLRWNAARNTFLSSKGTNNSDPRGPIITTAATAYSVPGGYAVLPITVIVGMVRLGAPTSADHALWISLDGVDGNSGLYLRYEDAGTLHILKSQVVSVGSGAFTINPAGSLMGVAIDSGTFALYGDGALIASGSHAQTFTSNTPLLGSESSDAAQGHPNGIFYFHAVWDRLLSADEFKRLSANPWQIFEPRKQNIYLAAASTIVSADAASAGVATTTGVSGAIRGSAGASVGVTTTAGAGVGVALSVAASAGAATVTGAGTVVIPSAGASAGVATVTGVSATVGASTGASAGIAAATGVSGAIAGSVASSAGTSTAKADTDAPIAVVTESNSGGYIRLPDYRRKKRQQAEAEPEQPAPNGQTVQQKQAAKPLFYADDTNQLSPYVPALFDVFAQRQQYILVQRQQQEIRRLIMYNIRARAALLAA